MSEIYEVLIVGGGHAGAQAAAALRQAGFDRRIGIVSDEPELPYERPPLSKEYLSGKKAFDRLLLRPERFWRERKIELLLGRKVVTVDADARSVTTEGGETLFYGNLIWAAGGSARRLTCTGSDLNGVHGIRTRADVDRLIVELEIANDVVVVGGGYIGLEAAAVLRGLGKSVTLLEALPRVLARVAGEPLSRFYEAEHRARGVKVFLDAEVAGIEGADGRVRGVRLADGMVIPCDIVIVGIGIVPSVAPLLDAGAAGTNGIDVDPFCRTSLPGVYAIGDCACCPNPYADGRAVRVESVQNANDQASVVAADIVGTPRAYDAVPWFWSNQYDLRLQTVGLSSGHDEVIVRQHPAGRSFSLVYLKDGHVVALDCVNMVRDYVQGRTLVMQRATVSTELLGNPSIALQDLAVASASSLLEAAR